MFDLNEKFQKNKDKTSLSLHKVWVWEFSIKTSPVVLTLILNDNFIVNVVKKQNRLQSFRKCTLSRLNTLLRHKNSWSRKLVTHTGSTRSLGLNEPTVQQRLAASRNFPAWKRQGSRLQTQRKASKRCHEIRRLTRKHTKKWPNGYLLLQVRRLHVF